MQFAEIKVQIIPPDTFSGVSAPEPGEEELSPVEETLRISPLLEATVVPVPVMLHPVSVL